MKKPKSETRQLTEIVCVRFTPTDMAEVRQEAGRRGVSVPQLLRESGLNQSRGAS